MTRNRTKAPTQNFAKLKISDFFVFGQEKILDFDKACLAICFPKLSSDQVRILAKHVKYP